MNLEAERLNMGLTLRQAAAKMGLNNYQVLRQAEIGGKRPFPATMKKIADFYGVQVTDIWPVDDQVPA